MGDAFLCIGRHASYHGRPSSVPPSTSRHTSSLRSRNNARADVLAGRPLQHRSQNYTPSYRKNSPSSVSGTQSTMRYGALPARGPLASIAQGYELRSFEHSPIHSPPCLELSQSKRKPFFNSTSALNLSSRPLTGSDRLRDRLSPPDVRNSSALSVPKPTRRPLSAEFRTSLTPPVTDRRQSPSPLPHPRNYKLLYEQEHARNSELEIKLKENSEKLSQLHQEIASITVKPVEKEVPFVSGMHEELIRRVKELEEKRKNLSTLQRDNEELLEENRVLARTVSRLQPS